MLQPIANFVVDTSQSGKLTDIGANFTHAFPVPDAGCFDKLLMAIDEACERASNSRLRGSLDEFSREPDLAFPPERPDIPKPQISVDRRP